MATVTLETTFGNIVLDIDEANAPITAANFLQYVRDGHYDGTIFHRVIDGFMIQGGGMNPGMSEKRGRAPIRHEGEATSRAGLRNVRGTVAMARTNEPHSASAQFFINVKDNGFLDFQAASGNAWGYVVFGKVTAGLDVVDTIKGQPTRSSGFHQDVPATDIVLKKASVG